MLPTSTALRILAPVAIALPLEAQTPNQGFRECVDVVHRLLGERGGDLFGWVSAPMADVTGDGVQELIVGATGVDSAGRNNNGAVYLFNGATGVQLYRKDGVRNSQALGTSVSAAGDVDMDGACDFIAGGPGAASVKGQARIFSGADGMLIHVVTPGVVGDRAGATVAGVGDVDGDGHDDVALGAPNDGSAGTSAGRVYVVSGADGTTLLWTIDGEAAGDQFGSGMGALGDVTDDGVPELAVGAMNGGPGNRGKAYVYDLVAQSRLYAVTPGQAGVNFGQFFVYGVGDLSGDGEPDLYVSDFAHAGGRGRAYFYDGTDGSLLFQLTGGSGDGFGIGRGLGDVDGDGHDDVLMGSWTNSTGATGAGQGEVFSGEDGSKLRTVTSTIAGEALGFDAHGLGDVNGDGRLDLVLTAANRGNNRGAVYVIGGGKQKERFGVGLAGSGGFVPTLVQSGCPELSGDVAFDVTDVLGDTLGCLAIGDQELAQPFRGGTLYTNLNRFVFPHRSTGTSGVAGGGSAQVAFSGDPDEGS